MSDMSKPDLAMYLVNLSTLMDFQRSTGGGPSQFILDEYNKHWGLLKDSIAEKEKKDEPETKSRDERRI